VIRDSEHIAATDELGLAIDAAGNSICQLLRTAAYAALGKV
jgi:hypothetical protein